MINVLAPAKPTVPIITTGETMPAGYRFESIPDGIAFRARDQGRLDVFVNHETSTVPFPFNAPLGGSPPTEATIQAHSLWIEKADGPDALPPPGKDYTFKREGGQLALIYLSPSW
jgi:hypothetical protein